MDGNGLALIRYNITQVVMSAGKRPKRDRVLLPPIAERYGTEQSYYRALRKMLSGLAQGTVQTVIPAYSSDRFQERQRRRLHDADESTFSALKVLQASLTRETNVTVNRILELEAQRHTVTFMQTARSALGVDLSAVVTQEDLGDYLRAAAARNTSLITSLSADVVKRVEQSVLAAGIRGDSVQALKKILTEQYAITDRRAQLIARDQTAKLNSDLNRIRQQQAGIDAYNWVTAHDERVRPLHKSIDGNEYQWGKPTGAEEGLPPGQPIQCRCIAQGIVTFGEPVKRTVEPITRTQTRKSTPKYVVVSGNGTVVFGPSSKTEAEAVAGPMNVRGRAASFFVKKVGGSLPVLPGAPAGSALAQAEALIVERAARNATLDANARKYVMEAGARDGKEHLIAYDAVTGNEIVRVDSKFKNKVVLPNSLVEATKDERRQIIIHHNHPGSHGFSFEDLNGEHKYRGSAGIFAHGDDGSEFFAKRGVKYFTDYEFKTAMRHLSEEIQPIADAFQREDRSLEAFQKASAFRAAANQIFYHFVSVVLHDRGYIAYRYTLGTKNLAALEPYRETLEAALQRVIARGKPK